MSNERFLSKEELTKIVGQVESTTTVFEDGSTYHPSRGYDSNGAAPRGRNDPPAGVFKRGDAMTAYTKMDIAMGSGAFLLVALMVYLIVITIMGATQREAHNATITETLNEAGEVTVMDITNDGPRLSSGSTILLKSNEVQEIYSCDLEYVTDEGTPTALVFCTPGSSATFTIDLTK